MTSHIAKQSETQSDAKQNDEATDDTNDVPEVVEFEHKGKLTIDPIVMIMPTAQVKMGSLSDCVAFFLEYAAIQVSKIDTRPNNNAHRTSVGSPPPSDGLKIDPIKIQQAIPSVAKAILAKFNSPIRLG